MGCHILENKTAVRLILFLIFYQPVNLQYTPKENTPLISLKGSVVTGTDKPVHVLICSSPKTPMGKSAEFIIDGKTREHVAVHNDKCYNSNEKMCAETECSCIPSENTMKWITEARGNVYACQMRFLEDNGNVLKAFASVSFTESGVINHKPVITTMNRKTKDTNNKNKEDELPENKTGLSSTLVPVIVALVLILLTIGIVVWAFRRCKYSYRGHLNSPEGVPLIKIQKHRKTTYSCTCGGTKVTIGNFQLFKPGVYADVVVVFVLTDLQLHKNAITNSLSKAAGPKLQSELDKRRLNVIKYGDVVPVDVKDFDLLMAKRVYFGCLPPISGDWTYFEQALVLCLQNCLEQANNDAAESIIIYTSDTTDETNDNNLPSMIAECYKKSIETYRSTNVSTFTERIFISIDRKTGTGMKTQEAFVETFEAVKEATKLETVFANQKAGEYQLLDVSETETAAIIQIVEKTWLSQYVGTGRDGENLQELDYKCINVIKVQKVCNRDLFDKYETLRSWLFQKLQNENDSFEQLEDIKNGRTNEMVMTACYSDNDELPRLANEINEYYLFHGAHDDQIAWITQHGLNITNESKSFCGDAIYAFESSTKSDQYADNKQNRDKSKPKKMILGRFALGEIFVTKHIKKFVGPPCKKCKDDTCTSESHKMNGFGSFDSIVIDGKWNFREFLIFNEQQCYPEYVITYKRQ